MVAADAELAALMATAEVSQGSLQAAEQFLGRAAQEMASVPPDRHTRLQAKLAMVRWPSPGGTATCRPWWWTRNGCWPPVADAGQLDVSEELRALALIRLGSAELWSLVARHPRATPMRAHMLLTLTRMGKTEPVESAFAGMDDEQRDRGAMRVAQAALRLARGDPRAAADALAPVLPARSGDAPGWVTQAFLLEAIARDALGDPAAAGRSWSTRLTSPSLTACSFHSCCIQRRSCSSATRRARVLVAARQKTQAKTLNKNRRC